MARVKGILFGIQLVLAGGLIAYLLGPALLLLGMSGPGPGATSSLLAIGPVIGLTLVVIGVVVGLRGYLSAE